MTIAGRAGPTAQDGQDAAPVGTPKTGGSGWRTKTLADRFDSRTNSIGLLRHLLAITVLVAHSWQVAFNAENPTVRLWHGQTQLGSMGVFGFFVLSGFLITGSGMKLPIWRFAWHRFLRIYPALWVCLAICAFVIAPAVAFAQGQRPVSFWLSPDGPAQYVTRNFFASMEQGTISGLFGDTPYGNGHPTTVNAPLWSLRYEVLCYLGVGVLAAVGVLRRARFVVPLLLAAVWGALILHTVEGPSLDKPVAFAGVAGPVPLLGLFAIHELVILAFLFLAGATLRVYQHRIPMHGSLAIVAAGALGYSLWSGGFLAFGMAAYAYLLLYLSVALPGTLASIGRRWDFSYGIYIYGYPVQLVLAVAGLQRFGLIPYTVVALAVTMAFAAASWYLVEKRVLRLKNVRLTYPDPSSR